jgi:hypothetical protein
MEQFVELLALIGADYDIASGEPVGSRVLGRAGLAFGGAWSGTALSLALLAAGRTAEVGIVLGNLGSMLTGERIVLDCGLL